MSLSIPNLKPAGISSTGIKSLNLPKPMSMKMPSIKNPVIPKTPSLKSFNISPFVKQDKIPKAPKIAIMKKAIKKNAGY